MRHPPSMARARLARPDLQRWTCALLLLTLGCWAWPHLYAATTARLSISALVATRCNVVVHVVNGVAAVSNTCGAVPAGSPDGRALLLVNQQERSVVVVY
ncbi:hypothetical protein GWL_06520 [Herbaspirillum sp. GW103]|uniref:hypothetical protein n=1 Tax=unclassified Herbaspirillum TaxID=2624150 RepID=UPI00025E2E75|nr:MULTISPECIES: hypothetical protein [unclassified Herbaspirillum]EIJ48618.1 hypothetical protein GWL_06520 [Herbaspirillum sp. GW103]MCI1006965.1 hypothetical protein [Herbaspirillum sp. C7C8]